MLIIGKVNKKRRIFKIKVLILSYYGRDNEKCRSVMID